eukprot:jgi/Mesvir1/12202/Mv00433-RA.1
MEESLKKLRSAVRGVVITSEDGGAYDHAREVFNHDLDRRPEAIIQVRGAHDVQLALKFAQENKKTVSVSGGRHMWSGRSMAGQVVIDMRLMRTIYVDLKERYAWVDAGCTLRDVDQETTPYDLATVGGQYPDTGIAGFCLGGGVGYLSAKHGLSVDNLMAAQIVTPDGTVKTVDDKQE